MTDDRTIELRGDDRRTYTYRVLSLFELEGREYALLMCLDEEDPTGAAPTSTVLMRLIQEGDQAIFQTIENDDEFERVMAFIQETAREMDAANGT